MKVILLVLLFTFSLWILLYLIVVVHESGHLLVCVINRVKIEGVYFGCNPSLGKIRLSIGKFHFGLNPMTGCIDYFIFKGFPKWRHALIILGGIVAQLLLVIPLLYLLLNYSLWLSLIAFFALFLNIAVLIGNAIPYCDVDGLKSDGLSFLHMLKK